MKNLFFIVLALPILLTSTHLFGQRQELAISPIGIVYPQYQLVQYERYFDTRQSLKVSLGWVIMVTTPTEEHWQLSLLRAQISSRMLGLPLVTAITFPVWACG